MNNIYPDVLPKTIVTFFAMFISLVGWAQKGTVVYNANIETRHIDHTNYDDIKGSPYLYDNWYAASILGSDGKLYDFSNVNFNGFTHELETKTDGQTEQIMSSYYLKVVVNTGANKETFLRGIHPEFARNIVCILYDGQKVKFIKKFEVRIEESVAQTPGIPTVFEKFSVSKEYYIMLEGDLSKIKLKKKSVISILGYKSEIEKYIKQEKLNLSKELELVQLLHHYESTLIP